MAPSGIPALTNPVAPKSPMRNLRLSSAARSGLLPVFLAAAFLSCVPPVKAPEVRLRTIGLDSLQEPIVGLAIYNPNPFPLHVQSVDYEVSLGDRLCGRGRRSQPLFLDAHDTTSADFSLSVDWTSLGEAIPLLLTDSVVFGVKGSYMVSTVFGRRRFRFNGSRAVSVKDEVSSFIENLFGE
jgi:LEA14-like dessication related protein